MKPNQKELDEFMLDLIEFLGKHFSAYFDKTKVGGGHQGLSISILNLKHGSELEVTTDGARVRLRSGSAERRLPPGLDKESLFSAAIADLLAIFENRMCLVSGRSGDGQGSGRGAFYLDLDDAEALRRFHRDHPDCSDAALKKWTAPGSIGT
ncbi:MAG: hypothetical protein JWP91_103 [Fibrobacteres bacterium]|nr:hypothetical protein [Fibrobacterota bacterium]